MENIEFFILGAAIIILLIFWAVVGIRHLRQLRDGVKEQWELIHDEFRLRADILPNLIETVRVYEKDSDDLVEKAIRARALAMKEYFPGAKKIELEYDLSQFINELIALGKKNAGLGHDTNFLELKKEIDDLEKNIDERSKTYNQMARYYNEHRKFPLLRPIALIFQFGHLNIFEFEK